MLGRLLDPDRPVRRWGAGACVLHYVVWGEEEVFVLRIWHGRESPWEGEAH